DLHDVEISAKLADPGFGPRDLFELVQLAVLVSTDPRLAEVDADARMASSVLGQQVIPTFRPDSLRHAGHPGWAAAVTQRGQDFIAAGALATDHGHQATDTTPLPEPEAARIYAAARAGEVSAGQAAAFAAHMLHQMARMSCEDGLVMQLHPGVLRNHHSGVHRRYGPDRGYDIPVPADFTRGLRPLLESFGDSSALRLVVFTVDEDTYTRELAPLAGVYPALLLGAPWWFLDSPDGMRRF